MGLKREPWNHMRIPVGVTSHVRMRCLPVTVPSTSHRYIFQCGLLPLHALDGLLGGGGLLLTPENISGARWMGREEYDSIHNHLQTPKYLFPNWLHDLKKLWTASQTPRKALLLMPLYERLLQPGFLFSSRTRQEYNRLREGNGSADTRITSLKRVLLCVAAREGRGLLCRLEPEGFA